jgi:hypothetical protein
MAKDMRWMVSVSNLKLKSSLGDMFPFPFLEVMMVEWRKDWRRFYKSKRKKDLVYLDNEFLYTVKLPSSCKILEIYKLRNIRKKVLRKVQEKRKIGVITLFWVPAQNKIQKNKIKNIFWRKIKIKW